MELRRLRVLLVEDDDAHAEIIRRSLRDQGGSHEVVRVSDGQEALDYLFPGGDGSERRSDVVLLDLRLPKVDGHEVLRRIRRAPLYDDAVVVVLTTSAAGEDVSAAYGNRANSYLVKPVGFEEFTALLGSLSSYWLACNTYATN